ncbi:MAG TPA: phosphatase PAP2 family protein [Thermoanaerobaculia bacterium]|nr:phosphatase PAP2 family protein [Thermoanaerobaculia bacterium]
MSRSDSLRRLRVEDVLCLFVALTLLSYIGLAGSWRLLRANTEDMWTVSFIGLPMSIIIFLASLRYALGSDGSTVGRWAAEVTEIARDWLPFLLFLLFYTTFHSALWITIHPRIEDAELLAIDRRLFGETPSVPMQQWTTPGVTSFMSLCYFLHLILPPLLAGLWYRRDIKVFRELLLAILICGAIGAIGYLLVPAVGPGVAFPQLYAKTLSGTLYRPIIDWMDVARAPRDVFPSLHIAVSAIVMWYAARYGRTLLAIVTPFIVGNWIATIYLRYHYAIDDVAGFVVAVISIVLAGAALSFEQRVTREA